MRSSIRWNNTRSEQTAAIETAKRHDPRRAGQLAALYGIGSATEYGCHYGMQSTKDLSRRQYREGFDEVNALLR